MAVYSKDLYQNTAAKILEEVKELILPTVIDMSEPADVQHAGLSIEAYADVLYTHIMALGYNNGDIRAAMADIFPERNPMFYPQQDELDAAGHMLLTLTNIQKVFKHQVWAFQGFHQETQALKPHKKVITEVKKSLLAISFDPEV